MRGRGRLIALWVLVLTVTACSGRGDLSSPPTTSGPTFSTADARYVSPTGNDRATGTESEPWRTLAHALQAVLPGQVLLVHGGTYQEQLSQLNIHQGTSTQRILVQPYPNEEPVVVKGFLWLRQPSYWTIDGLDVASDPTLTPAPRSLVKLTGGVNWVWRNSEISGSRGVANVLINGYGRGEPARWAFRGNCVHDMESPPGVTRGSNLILGNMVRAGPGVVSRNLFFDVPQGQNLILGTGTGGPTRVRIRFNTMYSSRIGAVLTNQTRRVHISRNILAQAPLLVRGDPQAVPSQGDLHNSLGQNLGVGSLFLRPAVDDKIPGPGNVLVHSLTFDATDSCDGFHTDAAVAIPYGRYGVG